MILLLRYWRLIAGAVVVAAVLVGIWRYGESRYSAGYEARIAEEAATAREKTDAANRADDVARRCALDHECLRSSDGWRRD